MLSPTQLPTSLLPTPDELEALLDLESTSTQIGLFDQTLLSPLTHYLAGGGKRFRSEFIEIGFLQSGGQIDPEQTRKIEVASQMIEAIHAGSMIIDDIQDQSEIRRGKPTLHRQYGIALALNAGNWLYFQAIQKLDQLRLDPTHELRLRKYINQIFVRAHLGQAVDVGTPMTLVPKNQVGSICLTAMELKTGALMALAFDLGAFLADPENAPRKPASKFARKFGIALQMMDDIGNFYAPPPKGKEDIRNNRPSFIWLVAAEIANESDYARFIHAAQMLPNESFITSWAELFHLKTEARTRASAYLWNSLEPALFDSQLEVRVENLMIKLENAYV